MSETRLAAPSNAAATSQANNPETPSGDEILAKFDHLVNLGVVKYDYSFVTENHRINGIDFEFRISKALKDKPSTTTSPIGTTGPAKLLPRPGSDINTQGAEVVDLGTTHFLAFNGFSSYRPHYLLLTADGYRRQWEPLDIDDFRAIHATLLMSGGLVFYNCGPEAGCSRLHKHMQAIPKESFGGSPWKNFDENAGAIPFGFFEKLEDALVPEASLSAYKKGLEAVERTLGKTTTTEEGAPPHNMIMDRGRIVVIPRRTAGIGSIGANAGGMLGMIWTQSNEAKQRWLDAGPWDVLKAGGSPELL